jgi:hypothetical protein
MAKGPAAGRRVGAIYGLVILFIDSIHIVGPIARR